jgi:hemoglobin/transferrin/lactoferrin receptor protein
MRVSKGGWQATPLSQRAAGRWGTTGGPFFFGPALARTRALPPALNRKRPARGAQLSRARRAAVCRRAIPVLISFAGNDALSEFYQMKFGRRPRAHKSLALALLLLLLSPAPAFARQDSRGSVAGAVRDAGGAAVAGAKVSLVTSQQAQVRSAETDAEGRFQFADVNPGSYELRIERAGFDARRAPVTVVAGEATEAAVTLEVAGLSEEITVTAETGLATDRERVAQQVNVISERSIQQRATSVLAQVADEEVGVSLQRTSPTVGAVLVRGLTEVGVYVDGVRYTQSTQRGGINTFFNLNEPTSLRAVEIQRGPNTAQYGSDGLGGTVQLVSRQPEFGFDAPETHGELSTYFTSADLAFGANQLVTYGTKRFGLLVNSNARRVNTLRPGGGVDSHSAITRFLGLPSDAVGGERLPDTAFTQYGGTVHMNYAPTDDQQFVFRYQRSHQDGGKRYDQLLGGDGNLIAELKNLHLDLFYGRYVRQGFGFFDNLSATVSYLAQREERVNQGGQGNPAAAITHDRERTTTTGFSFFMDKQLPHRNSFLVGGDIYYDRVGARSYNLDPSSGATATVRPRVPDRSRYVLAGLYVQDAFEAIQNRLRLTGALRYNVGSYRSREADSPVVNGRPLWPDDSLRAADLSGRAGAVATLFDGFNVAFSYSRGFRSPNITTLGSLGLVGVGFQVSAAEARALGGFVGTTADAAAVSSGVEVGGVSSETSNNYDLAFRYRRGRFDTEAVFFQIDYNDSIVRQTLILPPGAAGRQLGSQTITEQLPSGAVLVPLSTSPVLVQTNFGGSRIRGFEYEVDFRLTNELIFGGNYSYIHAADRATNDPPNLGGGGLPPQMGFLRLRYQPARSNFWVEAYSTLAGRQDRLSTLDLADRRTGAARSRAQIQNFFRRGACVRGLTTPGPSGQCNTAGGRLVATGETLAQVQNRLLPVGSVVNGVLVENDQTSVPLFTAIPGYGLVSLRGGFRFNESQEISFDFENIADKSHRAPGWGVDGPGRSLTARYQYRF